MLGWQAKKAMKAILFLMICDWLVQFRGGLEGQSGFLALVVFRRLIYSSVVYVRVLRPEALGYACCTLAHGHAGDALYIPLLDFICCLCCQAGVRKADAILASQKPTKRLQAKKRRH